MNEGYDKDGLGVGVREYSGDGLWDHCRCGGTYGVSQWRNMFRVVIWEYSGDGGRKLCPLTVYPSTCFHFYFHVLWLCSWPFPSYYDILYFYDLPLLCSRLILTQYINWCIFLVVLQFVNWRWFPSSHIFSLSLLYLLKSLSSLSSLSSSSGNYIFTKTKLWPSNLTSRLLINSRTLV